MIHVSLSDLLILGMLLGVVTLVIAWLIAVWRERRHESRARADLVSCRICGNIYENSTRKSLTACPRCGSLNEALKPKPI